MKFLKRKPKKEEKSEFETEGDSNQYITSKVAGYTYEVTVKELTGGTLREVKKPFIAWRWKDPEDHLTYLYSEDKKKNPVFWELFPQRKEELAKLKPEQIKKRLEKERQKLIKIQENPEKIKENPKNIEYNIMKYKAQLNATKWDKCAFMQFGYDGRKKFEFRREGSNYFPIGYNLDLDIMGIPSDIKKKNSSIALRNKDMKHSKHQTTWTKAKIFGYLLIIAMFLGSLFMLYKSYSLYDEHPVNQCIEQQLKTANTCAKINLGAIEENIKLTKELRQLAEEQNKRQATVIDGLIPRNLE